jgi:serine/threonine-protein kinase
MAITLDPQLLIGRDLGGYTLERVLGQGGFSWVFAARGRTGGAGAVKVLKPRYAADPQFAARFRNEAKVASQLDHPQIVRIHEVGTEGDLSYFAMDLCPDSLASVLEREGPMAEGRLLGIAIDIADALSYAHAAGVIHRDIKVDNILLREDGSAVLTDFGIARAAGQATSTGVNMTIGTPHYVSPEQAQGRPLDGRSDLYALGVTLYKAATGDLPFRSTDWFELARMHVEDPPTPPTARRPDLSGRLERVILRCLAKHPDDRYPSAAELAADLREIAAGSRKTADIPMPSLRTTAQRAAGRRSRSNPWVLRIGAVALVVLVALLVVLLARR